MQLVSVCRKKLPLLLIAVGLAIPMASAQAAEYPSRPIRIITPANPGGTTDFLARMLATHLTKLWGQQAIVDNRGSASGVNAAEITKLAAPDGYTLMIPYHQHTVNAALIAKLPYHPVNDFTPITQMTEGGLLLVVNPKHPAKNAKEFLEWAKTTTRPINFGSAGIGSGGHLAGELFKLMAGVDIEHVPYKGAGPALVDLMGGHIQMAFSDPLATLPQVRAGTVRALAVSGARRSAVAPEIPTVTESGLPGYDVQGWVGVAVRTGTPADRMRQQVNGAVVRERSRIPRELVAEKNRCFRERQLGRTLRVLTLGACSADGTLALSDNYLRVLITGERLPANRWAEVEAVAVSETGLMARSVSSPSRSPQVVAFNDDLGQGVTIGVG